jgi:hypothetical protein
MQRNWHNEAAAVWLAPLAGTIPLIPFMSIPSSPFYIGRLMDDPTHPFNWPTTGPLISALAVFFDAGILAILIVLFLVAPVYAGLWKYRKNTVRNTLVLCAGAGVIASQIARVIAHDFRQPDLRAFAGSGTPPILGCLCGLAAGSFIAYFANRSLANRRATRMLICCAPVAALGVSAILLMWRGR